MCCATCRSPQRGKTDMSYYSSEPISLDVSMRPLIISSSRLPSVKAQSMLDGKRAQYLLLSMKPWCGYEAHKTAFNLSQTRANPWNWHKKGRMTFGSVVFPTRLPFQNCRHFERFQGVRKEINFEGEERNYGKNRKRSARFFSFYTMPV